MTESGAVMLLQNQKEQLVRDEGWRQQTCDYIKSFLGEQSWEYAFFLTRSAQIKEIEQSPMLQGVTRSAAEFNHAAQDNDFIDSCCEKIMRDGLYEPIAKKGWFTQLIEKIKK